MTDYLEFNIADNGSKKRYEANIEGNLAIVEYIVAPDKIFLTHTEVPKELEGKGIASTMVKKVLQEIEKRELKLAPLCPFVAMYLKKHPEWKKLLAEGYYI